MGRKVRRREINKVEIKQVTENYFSTFMIIRMTIGIIFMFYMSDKESVLLAAGA